MNLEYSVTNSIGYITMNRPDKRNALSYELISELKQAFGRAEQDAMVKIIVLRANGESFCAGADLSYLQHLQSNSYAENLADSNHLKELFLQIYTLKKVVIAQVQGHALAGGCGLVTVCDFAFAVPEARFGYTEVRIGFVPAIVMVFLLRKIGEANAKQLLLSGELVKADHAQRVGLIRNTVPADKLADEVYAFAQLLLVSNSTHSMMLTKKMIAEVQSMNLSEALSFASSVNAEARASDDCKRGVAAFLNKEKIVW
ncbi:MAG TPA: enoyl-CoA hydratase-related protein [Ohtaekwangia sp.]|nr:enoyl-CoA hydratase-related protein [Ohtaekwangia sp.]